VSPNCCATSSERGTVTLFVPAGDGSFHRVHWVVPFRDEDGKLVENGYTPAYFCPFCGRGLGREHVPFEEPVRRSQPAKTESP
jgi:hypothetical protein